jgi:hypothetical protein
MRKLLILDEATQVFSQKIDNNYHKAKLAEEMKQKQITTFVDFR